jgi:hypothetical protein
MNDFPENKYKAQNGHVTACLYVGSCVTDICIPVRLYSMYFKGKIMYKYKVNGKS